MGPKYEFTNETIRINDHTLHRIRRLSDGELGGFIEKEENLSQEGDCWVDDDAKVYGNARVSGDAQVFGNAWIGGCAQVYGETSIHGHAQVYDHAKIYGNALVYSNAQVYDHAKVYGNATVSSHAQIFENAKIYNNAKVYDNAWIYGDAQVSGNAQVSGKAHVFNKAWIAGELHAFRGEITKNISDKAQLNADSAVQDFIYKIDDSQKLEVQTEYDSITEFFNEPIVNDLKLDTLVICAVDTKEPIIKLEKVKNKEKTDFKFIVNIINDQGEEFMFKSIIKSQEQLGQLVQQTVDALKNYPQFVKYIEDLENCL